MAECQLMELALVDAKEREERLNREIADFKRQLQEKMVELDENNGFKEQLARIGEYKDLAWRTKFGEKLDDKEVRALGIYRTIASLEKAVDQLNENIAKKEATLDKLLGGEDVAVKIGRNSINRLEVKRFFDEGFQDHMKRQRNEQSYENMSHLTKGKENINCTAGKLGPDDYEKVMQGLGPLITRHWHPDIEDLVNMVPDNNHIQTLDSLFSEARGKGITNLRCFSVENAQQFSLESSYKIDFDSGDSTTIHVRSARPDWFIYEPHENVMLGHNITSTTFLNSGIDFITVEIQSGGKERKYGLAQLQLSLFGIWQSTDSAQKTDRDYYGLYIDYTHGRLGDVTLVKLRNGKFQVDGSFGILSVPALCNELFQRMAK